MDLLQDALVDIQEYRTNVTLYMNTISLTSQSLTVIREKLRFI